MRGWRVDLGVTAGFVAFALTEEAVVRLPGGWWPYALALFAVLIALRRRLPLAGLAASCLHANALLYPGHVVTYRLWQLVAMIIFAYTAGRQVPPLRRTGPLGWVGVALVAGIGLTYYGVEPTDPMAAVFFPVAPWVLGVGIAVQQRQNSGAAAARAAVAVMEERVRIARELHDMVAHSVTVMVIQAGVVRRRLDAGLPVDGGLLRSIESSGRDAVGELRRTLGLLRGEGFSDPPVGLDRLDDLVAQMREAGLRVTLRRDGSPVALPAAADLSAYRIIQEALTNVLKHAGPTAVTVGVRHAGPMVELSVVDAGGASLVKAGAGQGLIGMRERVALFGGTLEAGPRPGGGYAVHARLPVPAGAVPA